MDQLSGIIKLKISESFYMTNSLPANFFAESIEVFFDIPPAYEKSPPCPQRFIWRGNEFQVVEVLEEWSDFQRRGRMARNMKPTHLAAASRAGSWGVGRFSFRVRVNGDQVFEIYYDRAPENAGDRKGHWFLHSERTLSNSK
jgi:hypothetical protein